MQLVTPDLGLIFWSLLVFIGVFLILRAKAWNPIMEALSKRETEITNALSAAKKAQQDVQNLYAKSEMLLAEAHKERDNVLVAAKTAGDAMIAEARAEARKLADSDLQAAKAVIASEKAAAMAEIKNMVATLSLEITEKVLRKDLSSDQAQKDLIGEYLKDIAIRQN
jgi:F-type H+-transporting ATPase subunit b